MLLHNNCWYDTYFCKNANGCERPFLALCDSVSQNISKSRNSCSQILQDVTNTNYFSSFLGQKANQNIEEHTEAKP